MLLQPTHLDIPLSPETLFGRPGPLVMEVGFGDGWFLTHLAREYPAWNLLGAEISVGSATRAFKRMHRERITNVRLYRGPARFVVRNLTPPLALHRVYVNFPDPWPKKRHHKRRIVKPSFLALVAEKLCDDGALHIATDWADYAEHIDEALEMSRLYDVVERRVHDGENALDRPTTKFEKRGLGKGHRIFDWRLVKNCPTATRAQTSRLASR